MEQMDFASFHSFKWNLLKCGPGGETKAMRRRYMLSDVPSHRNWWRNRTCTTGSGCFDTNNCAQKCHLRYLNTSRRPIQIANFIRHINNWCRNISKQQIEGTVKQATVPPNPNYRNNKIEKCGKMRVKILGPVTLWLIDEH